MLIGVVSDTHGHLGATRQAVQLLENFEVDLMIHCGDVGPAAIVGLFTRWPTHFVYGNMDDRHGLAEAIRAAGQTWHGRFGSLELEGKRIAFLHGDVSHHVSDAVASDRWDLVCHGHTHEAAQAMLGRTIVLNPGAVDRSERPSVAVVHLPSMQITPIAI